MRMPADEPIMQSKRVAPLGTDAPGERAAPFGFARGVRDIAHLALEPHDLDRVLRAVRPPARREKAGEAARRLGEGQEGVAHRRRDEELVADKLVGLAHRVAADRNGAGGVGAHIRSALFLGHRHADRQALLVSGWNVARIVDVGMDLRQPVFRQLRLLRQARRCGEGHGDRAAVARLDLRLHIVARGARDMRARARLAPRRSVQALFDGELHELVVAWMVAHEIDAIAVAIVGVELGRIAVGEDSEFERVGRAESGAERGEFVTRPAGAFARHAVLQRRVAAEKVVISEFARLVEDRVRRGAIAIDGVALKFVVRR
jgi:hypothetical protein